jgi:hypothetical protein
MEMRPAAGGATVRPNLTEVSGRERERILADRDQQLTDDPEPAAARQCEQRPTEVVDDPPDYWVQLTPPPMNRAEAELLWTGERAAWRPARLLRACHSTLPAHTTPLRKAERRRG